jgi:hypothetical protein
MLCNGLCFFFHVCLQKVKDIRLGPPGDGNLTVHKQKIKKSLWFISISRNTIIVLISAVLAFCFEMVGPSPFILSGMLKPWL